ncbi:hypothetical protein [Lysinibacillus fusiformis]|uniref:hypothetical protein n=1 Tax=Lysinibacillus fusiformis TaxID=28031 RepID=UPI003824E04E
MNNGTKIHTRIAKNLSKEHFFLVDDIEDEYIIIEEYSEEERAISKSSHICVNISKITDLNLSDKNRFKVYRYGNPDLKMEKSYFNNLKAQTFKNKKCDISLIILDHIKKTTYIVCAEVKRTLKISNLFDAREQIISSHIDLNILNSLLTYNSYNVERMFFIIFENYNISRNNNITSMQLLTDSKGRPIPTNLILEEHKTNTIYYTLDDREDMNSIDKNISTLKLWSHARLSFVAANK